MCCLVFYYLFPVAFVGVWLFILFRVFGGCLLFWFIAGNSFCYLLFVLWFGVVCGRLVCF